MFTILEIFNEDDNINHHGFSRDVTIVKALAETKNKTKLNLQNIAMFIGKVFRQNKQHFQS